MTISINSIVDKIENEIQKAKAAGKESQMREHIYSIKTLCDILLEDKSNSLRMEPIERPLAQPSVHQNIQTMSLGESEPIKTEDGANGDSIFDF